MSDKEFKRLSRRLRNICELDGKDFGGDTTDPDELVRRHQVAMQVMHRHIRSVLHDIKRARNVDLCFVIDATASMTWHIEGVKDSVHKIVQTLQACRDNPGGLERIRFGVVAYRDFDNPEPFEILEFGESATVCSDFCKQLRAHTGQHCDTCEDVIGGLDRATQLDWDSEAGTRIIFHMCDAPCHGTEYHDATISDNYPDGDPEGRTETELFKKIKELKIDYYFGKISDGTDMMLAKFAIAYGKNIRSFDVEEVKNIEGSIIESISTSAQATMEQSKLGIVGAELRDYELNEMQPDWRILPVQVGKYLDIKLPASIDDICDNVGFEEKKVYNVRVKIAERPFAEGSERIAFYGQDLFQGYDRTPKLPGRSRSLSRRRKDAEQPTEMVLKEYKHKGRRINTLERYRTACEIQTVASFMAEQFNSEHSLPIGLKFLKTKILILEGSDGIRFMTSERKLLNTSGFVKFTSNGNYVMNEVSAKLQQFSISQQMLQLVAAFSHWTYNVSDGYFMIVDLQGSICSATDGSREKMILMTDPAIHCKDVTRYAPLNLGVKGMEMFLNQHRCNQICRRLKLPDVDGGL